MKKELNLLKNKELDKKYSILENRVLEVEHKLIESKLKSNTKVIENVEILDIVNNYNLSNRERVDNKLSYGIYE